MKKIKYIYWFAFYNEDSPSVRYRAAFPLDFFRTHYDVNSTLVIPSYRPKQISIFLKAYLSALFFRKKDSVIVIQRVHSNFIYSSLLKLLVLVQKQYTVYDLDDADYLYCPSKTIYFFAKKCSHIAPGSREIGNHLAQFNTNMILTTSPTPDLGIVKKGRSQRFTIGWIGALSDDHRNSLIELVFPAVRALDFPCKLIILGVIHPEDIAFMTSYFDANKNIQLELPTNINWRNEREIQERISRFDIGISTLLDTTVQRAKSGIKAKQYLNNGVPVLGTNLPENDWVIKPGINGYYCANANEFKTRIIEFYEMNDSDYAQFSSNARASISDFNHENYYTSFIKMLD